MALVGELLSLLVSLAQEIGIIVGVGALTITLVGHLLSLHAHKNETVFGYVRAARSIRALALIVIIISGGAAILIHVQSGTPGVLAAPAFLFKWLLIALLATFYFVELRVEGMQRDAVEGFEGANWYALFIVHTMAPVAGWGLLLAIYTGWLATFAVIWAGFVWLMRRQSTILPKPAAPTPSIVPEPPVVPPPAPKPAPAPEVQKPVPVPGPRVEIHSLNASGVGRISKIEIVANHSILPMVAKLDLPAPAPAPAPKPVAPVTIVPELFKPAVPMPNLEESGLPALHVMPKRPEDIESSKRGPVVKMSDE